ncbi:MAG: TPM domain-containing protein [Aquabacterium sp.]
MNKLTRWMRHLWLDADDARRTLTPAGLQRLEALVAQSEARHLGELRLCVEAGLPAAALWRGVDARQRAVAVFGDLRVWDTEHNNGVLIYLLLADRRIEILADRGLRERVPATTWQAMVERLGQQLSQGDFETGLAAAIHDVERLLKQFFPAATHQRNPNELPDAVVLI